MTIEGTAHIIQAPQTVSGQGTVGLALIAESDVRPSRPDTNYYEADLSLALVKLRIDMERRIAVLAQMYQLRYPAPLSRLVRELQDRKVLQSNVVGPLVGMIRYGNEAAHGAEVAPDVAQLAERIEPVILANLDETIDQAQRNR